MKNLELVFKLVNGMSAGEKQESVTLKVRGVGRTNVGIRRRSNQDSILVDEDNSVFILADGMGGHLGGEEASRIATSVISTVLKDSSHLKNVNSEDKKYVDDLLSEAAKLTKIAIFEADREIVEQSRSRTDLRGMGSTIETLIFQDNVATIGHVGDSRVYLMRNGKLEMVTEDHSILNEEKKKRAMSEEEIANFPFKNRITRALGHLSDRQVDILQRDLKQGDTFLLCSDGLTDVADDWEIEEALLEADGDLDKASDHLVDMALDGGGPDNVSVVLVIAE
ncbi:MAG: protein phosphatase 2C domain-containing protein [Nitrospinota bacterium]|nr:protein phosphatase 2C domain-containing protein [Nitrospinota bacterium]